MSALLGLSPILGVFGLTTTLIVARMKPSATVAWVQAVTLFNIAMAIAAITVLITHGPSQTSVLTFAGWGLDVRLDALSVTMVSFIALVGWVVTRFSRAYLDGDPRRPTFLAGLCLTLATVSLLVVSGNLLQLVIAWIATSLALHHLLMLFRERPRVRAAARRKFLVARLGDVCLIGGAAALYTSFSTPDIGAMLDGGRALVVRCDVPLGVHAAALLLVLAACLKSAQVPAHGWLIDMVELPTPVSALLHAGLINAGGFLLIRFAEVIALSGPVLLALALIGALTAMVGSLAMLTQTSAKVSLAYSTVAQMGFMLFQIGLGAFGSAVLHLVAHSLYKAHAFCSAGSVVDLARARPRGLEPTRPSPWVILASFAAALAAFGLAAKLWGVTLMTEPALLALGSILVLGLTHMVVRACVIGAVNVRLGIVAGAVAAALTGSWLYLALQHGVQRVFAGLLPGFAPLDLGSAIVMLVAVLGFGLVTATQWLTPAWLRSTIGQRAYVLFKHGLYVR